MRKISSFFLFLFCIIQCQTLLSQDICDLPCNDSLQYVPAYSCEDAQLSAQSGSGPGWVNDFNGLCLSTVNTPPGNNAPFCNGSACVLNNPIWFSFIAAKDYINLDVCPGACMGDTFIGLQWALYDQCNNLLDAVSCYCTPSLPGDSLFNISASVTPGATYFLVIDGFSGSECKISFRANSKLSTKDVKEGRRVVKPAGNPVHDFLTLTNEGNQSTIRSTTIISSSGSQLLQSKSRNGDVQRIDVSVLPVGIYFYVVSMADGSRQSGKFVKI
jgi:hypothetical protein